MKTKKVVKPKAVKKVSKVIKPYAGPSRSMLSAEMKKNQVFGVPGVSKISQLPKKYR